MREHSANIDTPLWESCGKEKSSRNVDGSRDYLTLILTTALTQIAKPDAYEAPDALADLSQGWPTARKLIDQRLVDP